MSDQFQLHDLSPAPGSRKSRRRVGRGTGGKGHKTAGRGTKGLKARNSLRPGFEGGQTPMSMRIPKLKGFRNPNKDPYAIINLTTLNRFPAGSVITPDDLRQKGLVKHQGRVKVLALGEIDRALTIKADAFSEAAKAKIEAAGGSVEVLVSPPEGGSAGTPLGPSGHSPQSSPRSQGGETAGRGES